METGMAADDRYDKGMAVRREVLGDTWVDRSIAKRNAFNTEFILQQTAYCGAPAGNHAMHEAETVFAEG
jgi:hypothetical protein